MGIIRLLLPVLLLAPALAQGKGASAWKRNLAEAEVDWTVGTLTAQAGSAADMRMPGPSSARPGAERRARAAAEQKLRAALAILRPDKSFEEKEVGKRAMVSRTEYQSDGGVVLWLTLRFSDAVAAKPATVALRVPTMPFEFAPLIAGAGKEVRAGFATYRPATDCLSDAIRVQRDEKGRLALPPSAGNIDAFAGSALVICLEKTAR
jgi:hypothetical protein